MRKPRLLKFVPVVLAALAFVALAGGRASAGGCEIEENGALGWQTENADLAAVVSVESVEPSPRERTLRLECRVSERIRGDAADGARVVVTVPDRGGGSPWRPGTTCLAFLRAVRGPDGATTAWRLVSGETALRPIPSAGPESRFPSMAREIASTLDARGAVADADRLRTALVTWIADPDPGIAWSAATDLVRHAPLCEALTQTQRASILAAFLAQPSGKRSKAALAEAVAVARPAGAAAAIVDLVGTEETRWLTRAFASALVRIGDPEAETFVLRRLRAADAALSRDLLEVLAEIGGARGADAARGRLADADGRVRIDAAHAFGRIVRRLRGYSGRPSEAEGRTDLAAAYDRAKSADEARAALWALAQLDQAEAYEVLRKAETGDARADVRRDARRYLLNPRLSLVLSGS